MFRKLFLPLIKPFFIVIIIISSYISISLTKPAFFIVPRLMIQDFLYRIRYRVTKPPPEANDIILIAIDDNAYYEYGQKWPWSRDIFASLIYKISSDRPAVIGMNFGFPKRSEESEYDFFLKEAFRDADNVVVASYFGNDGMYIVPERYFQDVIKDYGFTNKPLDIDDIIRYSRLFEPLREGFFPGLSVSGNILDYSFEMKLLCAYYGINPVALKYQNRKIVVPEKDRKEIISVDEQGYVFINYMVKDRDLTVVPILDVINNQVPQGMFKDKIVIIGTIGEVFKERILTPLGSLSGIEVLANVVLMLLCGRFIIVVPFFVNLILFILFVVGSILSFWRFGAIRNAFILLGAIISFYVLSWFLIWFGIIIDFFSIPMFILIAYIAVEAMKYGTLIIEGIRLKKMVITDDVTGLSTRRYFVFKLASELKSAIRERLNLSVVIISIDNYDFITTSLGMEKAELVLKECGSLIRRNSRVSRGVDFIARYGEHSFAVILKGSPSEGAVKFVNRLKNVIERHRNLETGEEFKLGLSSGIVSVNLIKTEKPMLFIECAQKALERAEVKGPGNTVCYSEQQDRIDVQQYEDSGLNEVDLSYVADELKGKNKELREMINKLRSAYKEVATAEKFSAMGKLASSIHHELNNPLSALRTCLQRVTKDLEQPTDEKKVERTITMLNAALEEVSRMIEMNKGLKQLYKPAKAVLEQVSINKLFDEMLIFLENELTKHKVNVISNYEESLPLIEANKADLRQAYLNIILNAIDVMPEGGELKLETQIDKTNGQLQIKISDTGSGISQEHVNKIFEALFTTKGETKGTGLGLYVTKQKIEMYQGTIKVDSEVGKGTTFTIAFPIK